MFSEDLILESVSHEWNVLAWSSKRGVVGESQSAIVKHFDRINRKRVANAVRCGCRLCLRAVEHLVEPVAK